MADRRRGARLFPARRGALGLAATPAPPLAFILVGILLGPQIIGVLSRDVLLNLDVVISVALAALGIFVGFGLGAVTASGLPRLLLAAWVEAALTVLVVGGVMYALLSRWGLPVPADTLLFALVLGVCACASAATRLVNGSDVEARIARIVDLDDLPLVALGTIMVALAGSGGVANTLLVGAAATVLVAAGGALLFARANGEAERGVYVAGVVVLLGGLGAYTGVSPLLTGTLAALIWARGSTSADRIIAADLRALQHPLVALLLIVAGASIQWTAALLWITGPLVLLRLMGKLVGGAAAARLARVPAGQLAGVLVTPGVLGVALALNVQQVLNAPDALLISAVTVAVGVSELLSLAVADAGDEHP